MTPDRLAEIACDTTMSVPQYRAINLPEMLRRCLCMAILTSDLPDPNDHKFNCDLIDALSKRWGRGPG